MTKDISRDKSRPTTSKVNVSDQIFRYDNSCPLYVLAVVRNIGASVVPFRNRSDSSPVAKLMNIWPLAHWKN